MSQVFLKRKFKTAASKKKISLTETDSNHPQFIHFSSSADKGPFSSVHLGFSRDLGGSIGLPEV
jgi:hypothetical protein